MVKIGVISDTHGLIRPQALELLAGSRLIVHAGDIGSVSVIEALSRIAPVKAVRGNVDKGAWAECYPATETFDIVGRRIHVIHNLKELAGDPCADGFDVVISGHSHMPRREVKDGVLFLNPGSAGPRRFKLPVALATLEISEEEVEGRIHELPL